jgi:DNA-binding XRE family transcriptional regulator
MTNASQGLKDRSALVFRSARKAAGYTQQELAKLLGIQQGTISKIEDGKLFPDLFTWLHFAAILEIAERSIERGYIEGLSLRPVKLQNETRIGRFKIPAKYSQAQGNSIKMSKPAMLFAQKNIPAQASQELLREMGIESDYFTDVRHQLNQQFSLDLYGKLVDGGYVKKKNIEEIVDYSLEPECNGSISDSFKSTDSFEKLVGAYQAHYSYYDVDHVLKLDGTSQKKITLVFQASDHLHTSQVSRDTISFMKSYREKYYEKFFSKYLGKAVTATCENPIAIRTSPCIIHLQN